MGDDGKRSSPAAAAAAVDGDPTSMGKNSIRVVTIEVKSSDGKLPSSPPSTRIPPASESNWRACYLFV